MTAAISFLAGLPGVLDGAVGPAGLLAATDPAAGSGISRAVSSGSLRVDGRVVSSPLPRIVLALDEPVDAVELADAWDIERPVAVSGDVHQSTWELRAVERDLPSADRPWLASASPVAGCWELRVSLSGRPPGPLPDAVSGGSPAYDLRERGGLVTRVIVARRSVDASLVTAGDPAARGLLDAARARLPHARPGWDLAPDHPFVVVRTDSRVVAGAAFATGWAHALALASAVAVAPDAPPSVGADLVDALEALALDGDLPVLRFDGTAFLPGAAELRLGDRGYVVGPPYDGDADVETWAERGLVD